MKSKIWSVLLLILIPIGEIKTLFYTSQLKVDWYLLADHSRFIDNVMNDYANAFSFIIIFGFILFGEKTPFNKALCRFYFIISILDLLHLGAYDMQGLMFLKFVLAIMIWFFWAQPNAIKRLWQRR